MKYNMGGADGSSGQIQRKAIDKDTSSITINVITNNYHREIIKLLFSPGHYELVY
jgi:hypothetical protein